MQIISFLFFLLLGFVFNNHLNSRGVIQNPQNIKNELEKEFERDFLKIFPYYDFQEKNLHSIIAYFELTVSFYNFSRFYKELDSLQLKYREDLDIVRRICLSKLIMCYITMKVLECNETTNLYHKTISSNSDYIKNMNKLIFMMRDKNFSNNSEYCIEIKAEGYHDLLNTQSNDEKIDLLYIVSQQLSSYMKLNRLLSSIQNSEGKWVEALWYCMNIIKDGKDPNLDVYYYIVIKFLYFQNLFELAESYFEELKIKCPNSELVSKLKKVFCTN